jgi:hypothetical protein
MGVQPGAAKARLRILGQGGGVSLSPLTSRRSGTRVTNSLLLCADAIVTWFRRAVKTDRSTLSAGSVAAHDRHRRLPTTGVRIAARPLSPYARSRSWSRTPCEPGFQIHDCADMSSSGDQRRRRILGLCPALPTRSRANAQPSFAVGRSPALGPRRRRGRGRFPRGQLHLWACRARRTMLLSSRIARRESRARRPFAVIGAHEEPAVLPGGTPVPPRE